LGIACIHEKLGVDSVIVLTFVDILIQFVYTIYGQTSLPHAVFEK
jgi:hypothetical protein